MGCGRRPPAMVFTSTHSPWRITRIGNLLSFLGPRLSLREALEASVPPPKKGSPLSSARVPPSPALRTAHTAHVPRPTCLLGPCPRMGLPDVAER